MGEAGERGRTYQALIGVGANLGDRWAALTGAAKRLGETPGIFAVETSPVFETEPVGLTDQPLFLNAAIGVETTLTPEELLATLLALEQEFGRVRRERWGPRTLDLDLLMYEGETRATVTLTLPHPRMLERGFVTVPLRELLARPRFGGRQWEGLREQLEGLPPERRVKKFDPT